MHKWRKSFLLSMKSMKTQKPYNFIPLGWELVLFNAMCCSNNKIINKEEPIKIN